MRFLITAGPTREFIDEVRFISNRSSGAMGVALAEAACAAGHTVTLLLGAGVAEPGAKAGLRVHRFTSAGDLESLLENHFGECDVLLMAAAVSDYRPVRSEPGKREREASGGGRWVLEVEPTPDLVAAVGQCKRVDQKVIAFALEESARLQERARAKLRRKGVDAIVANPLETMESGEIEGMLITAEGVCEVPQPVDSENSEDSERLAEGGLRAKISKPTFARWLIERVERL